MASVYVGSNAQNLSVIYDTGSDYLVVEDLNCPTCVSTRFVRSTSTTFVNNGTATTLNYGSASLAGFLGNDTVSIDQAQTVSATDFQFFLTTS
jgi:phytepsin